MNKLKHGYNRFGPLNSDSFIIISCCHCFSGLLFRRNLFIWEQFLFFRIYCSYYFVIRDNISLWSPRFRGRVASARAWGKWEVSLPKGALVQYRSMMISKTSFKKYLNDSWIPQFPCSWNSRSSLIFCWVTIFCCAGRIYTSWASKHWGYTTVRPSVRYKLSYFMFVEPMITQVPSKFSYGGFMAWYKIFVKKKQMAYCCSPDWWESSRNSSRE